MLDAATKKSLRGADGAFHIEATRSQARTVLTVIGRRKGDVQPPRRNAWLYVDPTQIETATLTKFAPGWDVNLPMSCRIVGDRLEGYEDANLTVLPMTVRPTDAARDGALECSDADGGRGGQGKGRGARVQLLRAPRAAARAGQVGQAS